MSKSQALDFFTAKLAVNPEMPKYLHCMAAISSQMNHVEEANDYFRNAIENSSHKHLIRNDFAVHLSKQNRKLDAINELKKSVLDDEENPLLQKNLGAILGQRGQYKDALDCALNANYTTPNDSMNHRNVAKLYSVLGDTKQALEHNITAINLEKNLNKPHTSPYRAAAVQIISNGGFYFLNFNYVLLVLITFFFMQIRLNFFLFLISYIVFTI
jgi:predicted Zn-dependent protease